MPVRGVLFLEDPFKVFWLSFTLWAFVLVRILLRVPVFGLVNEGWVGTFEDSLRVEASVGFLILVLYSSIKLWSSLGFSLKLYFVGNEFSFKLWLANNKFSPALCLWVNEFLIVFFWGGNDFSSVFCLENNEFPGKCSDKFNWCASWNDGLRFVTCF